MIGKGGNDTYFVDVTGDIVTEVLNQGNDSLNPPFAYLLGANLENLTLLGNANINATGNTLNNILPIEAINHGNNTLNGGRG